MIPYQLKNFLDMILDPKSAENPDNYIASRKFSEGEFQITMSYLNGAAYISGVIHDRLFKLRYNFHDHGGGFLVGIDGLWSNLPLTRINLDAFLNTGGFIEGTYFGPHAERVTLRKPEDMNWNIWGCISRDLDVLQLLKLASKDLIDSAQPIYQLAAETTYNVDPDEFPETHKLLAAMIELEIQKHNKELKQFKKEVNALNWKDWEKVLLDFNKLSELNLVDITTIALVDRLTKEVTAPRLYTTTMRYRAVLVARKVERLREVLNARHNNS